MGHPNLKFFCVLSQYCQHQYIHLKANLSKELKNGIEILVGQVVLSYNNQSIVLINNSRPLGLLKV